MLTSEQINEAVQSAVPSVLEGLRKEISERAINQARDAAFGAMNKAVTEWVVAELVPEIHRTLAESKDGLIAAIPSMTAGIVQALCDSMTETLKKKLESSWERQQIFKAIVG